MRHFFSTELIQWYNLNKRDLPWRHTNDPYKIWLSEIILQQTQVTQGLSYYNAFVARYPDVSSLAEAPEDEVLRMWQGLGYYSRARNMHETAKTICERYNGQFPSDYDQILKLKGVGAYTAAAISSFAFGLPYAVVDGNVYRVLSRIFGVDLPVDSPEGKKAFAALAGDLLSKKEPALHNQAIMEFGALFCRPANPDCGSCVFLSSCIARANGQVNTLPVKSKRVKVRERHLNYLVLADKAKRVIVNKRQSSDIWKGLYEFSLVESDRKLSVEKLMAHNEVREICGNGYNLRHISEDYVHQLTHQKLHARFYVLQTAAVFTDSGSHVPVNELDNYAFPRLIGKFLEDCDLNEMFYF